MEQRRSIFTIISLPIIIDMLDENKNIEKALKNSEIFNYFSLEHKKFNRAPIKKIVEIKYIYIKKIIMVAIEP